jgi:tetratricopeptide (TPR) repeat protein
VEAALEEATARDRASAHEEVTDRDKAGSEHEVGSKHKVGSEHEVGSEEEKEGKEDGAGEAERTGSSVRGHARRRRAWLAVGGVAVLVAAVILLVVELSSARLPGETPTGGPTLSARQQAGEELIQAQTVEQEGQTNEAIALYAKVLSIEPKQPVALAEWGWLVWEQGTTQRDGALRDTGASAVREAVRVAPGAAAGHLYLGSIDLLQLREPATAATQYRLFLEAHPSASLVAGAAPLIRQAFEQSGQQLPTGVPSG